MALFVYTARDKTGRLQSGHLEVVDEHEVAVALRARGLLVTSVARKKSLAEKAAAGSRRRRLHGGVKAEDLALLCEQLSILISAGIPLLRSLEIICAQIESRPLLKAVEQVRRDVEAGRTLRDALARHPQIFSSLWINMIETGESSGHLAESLQQLARYVEMAELLRSKAATAMTYPMVLIVAATAAMAVFILKIIPTFKEIFASMDLELPPITQMVIGLSDFMRHNIHLMLIGVWAGGFALKRLIRTDQGRWLRDRLVLRLPVFKRLFISLQLAQFTRGLSTLLATGVPILYSMEIMERSATNTVYAQAIGQAKESVREGKPMTAPMEEAGELFPPMVVQMIRVGEEVGELAKMLARVATYYEGCVVKFLERLSVLFEPIAIAFMGLVIGTLVLSMFMPIFKLAGGGFGG